MFNFYCNAIKAIATEDQYYHTRNAFLKCKSLSGFEVSVLYRKLTTISRTVH